MTKHQVSLDSRRLEGEVTSKTHKNRLSYLMSSRRRTSASAVRSASSTSERFRIRLCFGRTEQRASVRTRGKQGGSERGTYRESRTARQPRMGRVRSSGRSPPRYLRHTRPFVSHTALPKSSAKDSRSLPNFGLFLRVVEEQVASIVLLRVLLERRVDQRRLGGNVRQRPDLAVRVRVAGAL